MNAGGFYVEPDDLDEEERAALDSYLRRHFPGGEQTPDERLSGLTGEPIENLRGQDRETAEWLVRVGRGEEPPDALTPH